MFRNAIIAEGFDAWASQTLVAAGPGLSFRENLLVTNRGHAVQPLRRGGNSRPDRPRRAFGLWLLPRRCRLVQWDARVRVLAWSLARFTRGAWLAVAVED